MREGKSTIAHPSRPKNKPPLSPFEIYAKTPVEPEPGERQLQTGKCPATLLPINPSCCGCRDVGQQIFEIYRVKFRLEKVNLSSERLKQYDRPECSEIGCLGHDFFGMAARAGELRSPGHAGAAMPQAVRDQLSAGSPRGSDRGNRKLFGKIWHHGNTETQRKPEDRIGQGEGELRVLP